ncbi:hypothetical protein BDA99DRAFT_464085 [Phascolomyces articulosus]|uniref:CAP-Gly domain-containing protein n=1 Tax=Phascolomyces articulosus TaxID=60185 RepID=A0AAD5PDL8_9FUNG|nr:hypothetical protein BDA99DRAFT_464085 [Phascolomyces articulosus]
MSRIARPFHVTLHEDSVQEPMSRIASGYQNGPSTKKRLARLPNSYTRDDSMGPADAPKVQRRSNPMASSTTMTKRPSKTAKATMRSSTSSTEELSEPEPILRYSPPNNKATTKTRSSFHSVSSTPSPNELSATITKTAVNGGKKSPSTSTTTNTTSATAIPVGSTVSVPSMGVSGTLRFMGPTDFKPGIWAGIELDDSGMGKNDGCVQGIRYFTCPPQKGLFISDSKIVALNVDPPVEGKKANNTSATMISNHTGLSPPTQRRSRQPLPEASRSSIVSSRRSKTTLSTSSRKPSKTSVTRSADTAGTTKSSRYSADRSAVDKSSRYSVDHSKSSRYSLDNKSSSGAVDKSSKYSVASTGGVDKSSRYSIDKSSILDAPPVPPVPDVNTQNELLQKRTSLLQDTLAPSSAISTSPSSTPSPAAITNGDLRTSPDTSTSGGVSEQELYHLYELLEKEQREKDKLAAEITSKEAAWERLVSTKESYALRVKEKEDEITRLQNNLSDIQEKFTTAQQQLEEQQTQLAKNIKDDSSQEQSLRRIEKLEGIIEDMKTKASDTMESYESQLRESKGQLDHLRHALKEQETMSAALERECEELRKAGLEAIHAYETSIQELKKQCQTTEEDKNRQIEGLNKIISDLRGGGDFTTEDHQDRYADEWHDQRIRLEEQLELATDEVEQERIRNNTLVHENDKLKSEIQLFHMSTASSDDRFDTLRRELETELQDKRRLMEEADAAFEAQARAEDENYQMKMARVKMERELEEAQQQIQLLQQQNPDHVTDTTPATPSELAQLTTQLTEEQNARKLLQQECDRLRESQNGLEQECMRLMDELMVVEQGGNKSSTASTTDHGSNTSSVELQQRIKNLEDEVLQERLRYNDLEHTKRTEINQLSNELAELETLVENGVFEDNDLQEALNIERKRVQSLEKELKALKETNKPTTPVTLSEPKTHQKSPSTITTKQQPSINDDLYCELCETHGHDVLDCTALEPFEGQMKNPKDQQVYCENCDLAGIHSTLDCPNQDEIF